MNYFDPFNQMPAPLSTLASEVDRHFYIIFWLSVVFFVGITGAMLWFSIRYRKRPGVKAEITGHNTPLEVFWTFSPLIILFFLFDIGFKGYMAGLVSPANSLEIRVRAMQWNWEFEHPNGMVQMNELTVPVAKPVRLIMSSSDVLHSFFVPEFRVKRDVVPGMYSTLWFDALQPALGRDVQVFCAEYCGAPSGTTKGTEKNTNHSTMLATIHVVTSQQYDKFLEEGPPPPLECASDASPAACWGKQLYSKYGCQGCHNIDGATSVPAPNWKGIWGRQEQIVGAGTIMVDENYIKESILEPQSKVVQGYTNVVMPPFRLPDKQIDAIIAFMKSLGESK